MAVGRQGIPRRIPVSPLSFPSGMGFAAARSGQGRARQRGAKPPLTARTDAKQSREEGKSHFLIRFTHYEVRIPKERGRLRPLFLLVTRN